MPATAAERKRKQIATMKNNGTYHEYLKSQKERMANSRQKFKTDLRSLSEKEQKETILKKRSYERDRKAAYRLKLKNQKANTPTTTLASPSRSAYKNKASYGKAVARVKKNLPESPRKKRAVIKHLAFEQLKIKPFTSKKRQFDLNNRRSTEAEQSVLEFYERDDISRQAPGKRDVLKVKINGSKIEKQKRHLNMSIREAYNLWKEENKNVKLGKSTFATLRPQHVLPTSKLPRNVCVCRYHENFILL